MKKFIFKIILFLFSYLTLIVTLFFITPFNRNNFHDSLEQKKEHSKKSEILISGGSNVLFGIDSEVISKKTHFRTTNLGIAGGYGLKHIISILPETKSNQRVFIIPEYENFFDDNINGYSTSLCWNIYYYPKNIIFLKFEQIKKLFKLSHRFIKDNIIGFFLDTNTYDIRKIKNNGDYILIDDNQKDFEHHLINGELNNESVKYLKNVLKVKRHYYLLFPPISESYYRLNYNKIISILKEFNEERNVLSNNFLQSVYPDSLFYDSSYHLRNYGKVLNTKRISSLINNITLTEEQ